MTTIRYEWKSTLANLETLLALINKESVNKITLFATQGTPTDSYSENSDGPETNLPLVSALAELDLPGFKPLRLVFDGLILTAQRRSRYLEVRDLLDVAVASGKVYFSATTVPFTSTNTPDEAADVMQATGPQVLLDEQSRRQYFSMLSSVSEEEFDKGS